MIMAKAVHVVITYDPDTETVVCRACGTVPVGWRTCRGVRSPRCGPALYAQRQHHKKRETHGLTAQEAREFVAGKACEICGGSHLLCVDHDHQTGVIRGVLCRKCNSGLGLFRDELRLVQKAAEYLQR